MNARHIRAEEFVKEHYGKLDTALAEAYLSDHYDSYEQRIEPASAACAATGDVAGRRKSLGAIRPSILEAR